jgi:acyl-coenzyme A synthetase/AMP-(fatty) acid ligase
LRCEPSGERALDHAQKLRHEILLACRDELPEHKVPASIRFVPSLDVAASGKLVRHDA